MKILHIIATVDPAYGGPVEGIIRQNEAMVGGEREIASLDPPDSPFLATFPIKVHALGNYKTGESWKQALKRYGVSSKIIPWLEDNVSKYDCVIVNGLWNFGTFAAARVLPRSGVPYFVFTHGMLDPWFRSNFPAKHVLKQLFWLFSEGPLLAKANAVLFTTDEESKLARTMFWGYRYRETIVGYGTAEPPPALDGESEAFRGLIPKLGERKFLLFLSRIHAKKGCDLLVRAFGRVASNFPELDLVIAGPDQDGLQRQLEQMANELGVGNRIHWPGMLSGPAKWGAFRSAEAFILPSHSENFGIVVAEALACSTPVLLSDKVNIWREVVASGAGFVEPDDVSGTETLIRRFLAITDQERTQMQRNAQHCFNAHFNLKTNVRVLEDTLRQAVWKQRK